MRFKGGADQLRRNHLTMQVRKGGAMTRLRNLTIALPLMLASPWGLADDGYLIAPKEPVQGASQLEWSHRWWQWAFSFERTRSPVADRTGQFCASRQAGPVWFLAGTYGTHRTERTCHVPRDKILFFPLINYVSFQDANAPRPCKALMEKAAALTDEPSVLVLEIDGHRIDGLRVHRQAGRDCFSLVPGEQPDAAGDGYYVALKPLVPGVHTLNFGGILPSLTQAVTYTLVVE
jgi:hypothetical protein